MRVHVCVRVYVQDTQGKVPSLLSAVCKPDNVNSCAVVAAVGCLRHWSSVCAYFQPVSIVLII